MSVPRDNPELLKAQYRAFSRQLPLMYFILLTNTWALAVSHYADAPVWLTVSIPALFTVLCGIRVAGWWRSRSVVPTAEIAFRALTLTNRLTGILTVAFSAWALGLYPYGDQLSRAHVAFYMAITVIACIFSLMHLRPAAFTVAISANIVFIAFFGSSGNLTFMAMAANALLVTIAMMFILQANYLDFAQMVDGRTSLKALSNENFRLANLDSLTGLPNRRQFFARLDEEFLAAQTQGYRLAVGVVDLDGFKPVNDIYGHAVGDKLLIAVGERLQAACGEAHVARLGGDEFALIFKEVSDVELLKRGEKICTALRKTFDLTEANVQISGSVGFTVFPELASNAADLYEQADYALYHSKRTSRGNAVLFSTEHEAEIHRNAKIERALRAADLDEELSVVFQPVVDARTERTVAFEALARWNSPTLGHVPPDQFIPVAERAGIVTRLMRVLLEKALIVVADWPEDIRLSFNVSNHDINSPEGVIRIIGIILKSGVDPRRIDFEITETAIMRDFEQAQSAITTLKTFGCGVSLDDFGTGFSSLSQLHALPLTKIKIDRSFVAQLDERPASYKIVKSLIALSRDMELGCVIEGVETENELKALLNLGGFEIQGYYYSPPLPASELAAFLDAPVAAARSA
ncbi:MAG: EAL domain-containing protein [Xanthobacteraceae bacterium]|nr:EAL domain-containing protein [Xanthobacteraceae bacterium]